MFDDGEGQGPAQRNVLGTSLTTCSDKPLTGFYRTGCCHTGPDDVGLHTVCVQLTEEFLAFSQSVGNDLSTPMPEYGFAGLKPGQRWCLCASRWKQALDAGQAPRVILTGTHEATLRVVSMQELLRHAVDAH